MRVVPCGHQCLCKECSDKLGRHSLCPMCRRRIAEFESHSIVLANSANSHLPAQASREPEPLPPRIPPVQPASAAADPRQDERRPIVQGQSTSLVVCLLCVMVFTGLRLYSVILACGPGTESVVGAWPRHAKLAVLLAAGTCVPCPAQHFRRDGLWCQKCPVRQVSNSGSAACATPGAETCPKGKYDNALSQGCIDCGAGYFKALAGSGMCVSCPINTFAAVPASSKCTPCRRGQVSEVSAPLQNKQARCCRDSVSFRTHTHTYRHNKTLPEMTTHVFIYSLATVHVLTHSLATVHVLRHSLVPVFRH